MYFICNFTNIYPFFRYKINIGFLFIFFYISFLITTYPMTIFSFAAIFAVLGLANNTVSYAFAGSLLDTAQQQRCEPAAR